MTPAGRPIVPLKRRRIREMKQFFANPRWGAPRIHGELLKRGIDIVQIERGQVNMARRRGRVPRLKTFS